MRTLLRPNPTVGAYNTHETATEPTSTGDFLGESAGKNAVPMEPQVGFMASYPARCQFLLALFFMLPYFEK